MKKYDLDRGDYLVKNGKKHYRVVALRDIPEHGIKAGDKGGYIRLKKNLSQKGSSWVDERAIVTDNARVSGSALIYGDVLLTDNTLVKGRAIVGGNTVISGDTVIFGHVYIDNPVCTYKDSGTCGTLGYASRNAAREVRYTRISISGKTRIFDEVKITGNVIIKNSVLFGKLYLYGNSSVIDNAGRIHANGTITYTIKAFNMERMSSKRRLLLVTASKKPAVKAQKVDDHAVSDKRDAIAVG